MSHRRLRITRSLIAVAALALSALVAPQMASADPPPPLPTAATVTVTTDPAIAASLGTLPSGSLPAVLAAVGTPFDVGVSLTDAGGMPAVYEYPATVTLTATGPGVLQTTTATLPAGASSLHISTSYSQATAALTVTASITATPPEHTTVPPTVSGVAAAFPVDLSLTLIDGQSPALKNGTAGADAAGCAVVDAAHPMCGVVTLPRGATGGTALSLGACPTGATCTARSLVTQFLGDLTGPDGADLYTRTAPASMSIYCDKTLCGKGGVASYRAQWSESATGALTIAPLCPAKGIIGADQTFCTDVVSSSRLNAGDLRLVVLFLHDVRGMI
ncbi:hypothetical protein QF046_003034 [Microbacterium sp. W4I4]|uniref:hypothetical protein n=1 Tax=Microbacterium sp. W4I4 TaxID=3042295 RepID=UPI0027816477|nr:hypothetical protein [Microbacterium sp. W4I4]MDQ0615393.1 hypothetical protein [Microbacterium sp. W4I4]